MTRRLTAAMLLLAAIVAAAEAGRASALEVTAVRCWTLADTTRIAIEITGIGRLTNVVDQGVL